MTTADFEKIALWMGWVKQEMSNGVSEWWGLDAEGLDDFKGYASRKSSLTDAEAVEAMNRLVEKGQHPLIAHAKDGWSILLNCHKQRRERKAGAIYGQPTIHEAVEAALLQLIAAEGGKGVGSDGRSISRG